jgi:hypothetical protein
MKQQEMNELVRRTVRDALSTSRIDIASTLSELGWRTLADTDKELAVTALFEEQGRLALSTRALDFVAAAELDVEPNTLFLWPMTNGSNINDRRRTQRVNVEGLALQRNVLAGQFILAPVNDRVCVIDISDLKENALSGMAVDAGWAFVSCSGLIASDVGPWLGLELVASLALASELVGLAERMIELATVHVTERHQFGRPIGANQAVQFRLADAYAAMAGARSLVSAAWGDGSPEAALTAKTVAGQAHCVVVDNVLQVGGAIGLSEEHPFPHLVRRGFAVDAVLGSYLDAVGMLTEEPERIRLAGPIGAF